MKVKQLSLFLENKPGALSRPVKLLSKAKFNILTLSIADTQQFGILRFVVRDWEKAQATPGAGRLCGESVRHGRHRGGR